MIDNNQIAFLTLVIGVMVKPSEFNAPETEAAYPIGHLIGNFEINQGLLNFKHQIDIHMRCALFDIVLLQPLNDELFI